MQFVNLSRGVGAFLGWGGPVCGLILVPLDRWIICGREGAWSCGGGLASPAPSSYWVGLASLGPSGLGGGGGGVGRVDQAVAERGLLVLCSVLGGCHLPLLRLCTVVCSRSPGSASLLLCIGTSLVFLTPLNGVMKQIAQTERELQS